MQFPEKKRDCKEKGLMLDVQLKYELLVIVGY